MKKAVKVLLGIAAVGATASAVTLAVKKYKDSRKKYVCDEFEECDDDYFDEESDDFDEEYHLTPEEEAELTSTDEYEFGEADADETDDGSRYFMKDDVTFIKYMLCGIRNITALMGKRMEDTGRLIRRRNVSNIGKVSEIRYMWSHYKDNLDLINSCIENIESMLKGYRPDDYYDYMNMEREDTNDGE